MHTDIVRCTECSYEQVMGEPPTITLDPANPDLPSSVYLPKDISKIRESKHRSDVVTCPNCGRPVPRFVAEAARLDVLRHIHEWHETWKKGFWGGKKVHRTETRQTFNAFLAAVIFRAASRCHVCAAEVQTGGVQCASGGHNGLLQDAKAAIAGAAGPAGQTALRGFEVVASKGGGNVVGGRSKEALGGSRLLAQGNRPGSAGALVVSRTSTIESLSAQRETLQYHVEAQAQSLVTSALCKLLGLRRIDDFQFDPRVERHQRIWMFGAFIFELYSATDVVTGPFALHREYILREILHVANFGEGEEHYVQRFHDIKDFFDTIFPAPCVVDEDTPMGRILQRRRFVGQRMNVRQFFSIAESLICRLNSIHPICSTASPKAKEYHEAMRHLVARSIVYHRSENLGSEPVNVPPDHEVAPWQAQRLEKRNVRSCVFRKWCRAAQQRRMQASVQPRRQAPSGSTPAERLARVLFVILDKVAEGHCGKAFSRFVIAEPLLAKCCPEGNWRDHYPSEELRVLFEFCGWQRDDRICLDLSVESNLRAMKAQLTTLRSMHSQGKFTLTAEQRIKWLGTSFSIQGDTAAFVAYSQEH